MGLPLLPALSLSFHPGKGRPMVFLVSPRSSTPDRHGHKTWSPLPDPSPTQWWQLYSKCRRPGIWGPDCPCSSLLIGWRSHIMKGKLETPGASTPPPLPVSLTEWGYHPWKRRSLPVALVQWSRDPSQEKFRPQDTALNSV